MNYIKEIPRCEHNLITPEVIEKLKMLCWDANANIIIEVGTFLGTGTTTLFNCLVAPRNGKVICVDNCVVDFRKRNGIHRPESHYHLLLNNLKALQFVDLVRASSTEASYIIEDGIADIIFLDAGHSYTDVYHDIVNWRPKLKKGGILCGDDFQMNDVKAAVTYLLPESQNDGRVWWIKL